MQEDAVVQAPFELLSFTLLEGRLPRRCLRLKLQEDGMFELHVEKGAADRPLSQFSRAIPLERAQQLASRLQELGVFGWEESYGNVEGAPMLRWTFSCVFKTDVFAIASRGGSDVPSGFSALLEELYRLDFPRGEARPVAGAFSTPAAGAMQGVDFSKLSSLFAESGLEGLDLGSMGGLEGLDLGSMGALFSELQSNPALLQQRMRSEFAAMSPDQQQALLDVLASSGIASRAWWERWLRGF